MSFLASILDSFGTTRRAKYGCCCGAVKIDLNVPGSSHCLVEQTTAICHCHDCMGFVRACGKNGESVTFNNGTQLVQFYKVRRSVGSILKASFFMLFVIYSNLLKMISIDSYRVT